MAATSEELSARLDAIKKSRDSGVLVVRHGETMTTFRSLAEMEKIIAALEAELAASDGATRYRTVRLQTKDGW